MPHKKICENNPDHKYDVELTVLCPQCSLPGIDLNRSQYRGAVVYRQFDTGQGVAGRRRGLRSVNVIWPTINPSGD